MNTTIGVLSSLLSDDGTNYEGLTVTPAAGSVTFAAVEGGTGSDNIDLILTPKGTGGVTYLSKVISKAGTASLTAAEVTNTFVRVTATGTETLPAATTLGQAVTVVSTTAAVVSVDVASVSDYIILDGTTLTAGNKATSDGTTNATLSCINEITNYWRCYSIAGAWTDGG
jgi:hypothetical protein